MGLICLFCTSATENYFSGVIFAIGSLMDDPASASTTEATASSADEENSSPGDMTIHLPGLPVTADCPMAEAEQDDREDNWTDTGSSTFHGFTSEEVEEQERNNQLRR